MAVKATKSKSVESKAAIKQNIKGKGSTNKTKHSAQSPSANPRQETSKDDKLKLKDCGLCGCALSPERFQVINGKEDSSIRRFIIDVIRRSTFVRDTPKAGVFRRTTASKFECGNNLDQFVLPFKTQLSITSHLQELLEQAAFDLTSAENQTLMQQNYWTSPITLEWNVWVKLLEDAAWSSSLSNAYHFRTLLRQSCSLRHARVHRVSISTIDLYHITCSVEQLLLILGSPTASSLVSRYRIWMADLLEWLQNLHSEANDRQEMSLALERKDLEIEMSKRLASVVRVAVCDRFVPDAATKADLAEERIKVASWLLIPFRLWDIRIFQRTIRFIQDFTARRRCHVALSIAILLIASSLRCWIMQRKHNVISRLKIRN